MALRWTGLSLVALLFFVFPETVRSHSASAYRIDTMSHGIRLSLLVPRRTYPRNALVSTTITVRNVSKHVVRLDTFPPINGGQGPEVSVIDASGDIVYPPALSKVFRLPNPFPGRLTLGPGQSYTIHDDVILRANGVYADALIEGPKAARTISTPVLRMRLGPSKAPRVDLHTNSGNAYAEIRPVKQARGALLYMSAAKCSQPEAISQQLDWMPSSGTRLVSGCRHLVEWHAVAGWRGSPVAVIDYVRH